MKTTYAPNSIPLASKTKAKPFPVCHVAQIDPKPPEHIWLVEQLWLDNGVGIVGGQAKTNKTFLAVELAITVACGGKAFGSFAAPSAGAVLFYGAEDSLPDLRARFEGLAKIKGLSLATLPIYMLDVPQMRLDQRGDIERLHASIEIFKPKLLVLDPFVRIARIDENKVADVASVLADLRARQRTYNISVMVIHHARKSPAANPMQTFRGSSDFSAWSDTNLHLARKADQLTLTIEHRSAHSPQPLSLTFIEEPVPHLSLLKQDAQPITFPTDTLQNEIISLLEGVSYPLPTVEIRRRLSKRKADIVLALEELKAKELVTRKSSGWILSRP